MITRECRPKSFDEMAGQKLNIKMLQAIVNKPKDAPKVIIMQGAFGSGKTTSARIMAYALNCLSDGKKPCGKCKNCKQQLDTSAFYAEYDSAVIGSVEKIRELRDTFMYTVSNGYKVIVLDEVHLVSPQGQSALLKVLEESPENIFYILCTTEVEKILPTIRSRSLELRYETVPAKDVVLNLKSISETKGIDIEDKLLYAIAKKSNGHMRNAHMLLDQYQMIGKESFIETLRTSRPSIYKYFYSLANRDKELTFSAISEVLTFPLAETTNEFSSFVSELTKVLVGYSQDEKIAKIVQTLGSDTIKLIRICISDWVQQAFQSDATLETALLCIYQMMNSGTQQTQQVDRRMRR